jgi:Domain of unknown function (DUF4838)/Glycosyl hydrolase family 67 N-terminus
MRRFLIALLIILAPLSQAAEKLTLAKDGQSSYAIVLRENASPSEKRGAEEIQSFIEQLSSAKLPIVGDGQPLPKSAILIGDTRHSGEFIGDKRRINLGDEGFVLKTAGPHVIIYGSPVRGAMYGSTALLEKLGVRWFTPTVTFLPRTRHLQLEPLDQTQTPAFEYREVYITEAFDKDFAARLRLNGQHHRLDESTGGQIRYSHFVHTFDELIPRKLFGDHPEYFPVIKGKRTDGYVQRCLTNPDVLKLATANVLQWIKDDPGAMIYSVSQNDTHHWCECENCTKIASQYGGVQSGLYLWFVNQVAEEVEKQHPGKLIDTLAYQFTEAPPKNIAPRKNVRVRLCPIANCTAHPYNLCQAAPTLKFMQHLDGWSKITDTLYVWHYNTDFAHYLQPFPDFGEFPANTRLYKDSGVKGIFFEGAYGPGGGGSFSDLQVYVMSKLLWNVAEDDKALVKEWHHGVYGKAAGPMLQWFDLLHAKVAEPANSQHHFFIYSNPKAAYLSGDTVSQGDRLFDEAENLAKGNPTAEEYVAKARLCLRYVKLVQKPTLGPEFDSFVADLKRFKVGHIREGVATEAWERDYRAKHK